MENRNEMEIDLLGLLLHLKSKIWIILLAAVVFALGGFVIAKATNSPVYTATARLYVYQKNVAPDGTAEVLDNSSLSIATQLLRDCAVIITGETVTGEVVGDLNLNMDAKALSKAVTVSYRENTRILDLSYTDTVPQRAADVLNAVCDEAAQQITKIMNVDAINPVFKASVPAANNSVDANKSAITAAIIGAVLAAVVIVVIFLMDDTIRNEDDVDNYLGVSTLAAIPVSAELKVVRPSRKSGKKKIGKR